MIGFFPSLYEDELLMSGWARFFELLGLSGEERARTMLFGSRIKQGEDFPSRLAYFVEQLPPSAAMPINDLIRRHTILPLIAPFVTTEKRDRIIAEMKGTMPNRATRGLLGKRRIIRLRFCQQCADEDRSKYGVTYWHRLHQVDAVMVCPRHRLFLSESVCYRNNRSTYVTAESVVPVTSKAQIVDANDPLEAILLWIAHEIAWLLSQVSISFDRDRLKETYRSRLSQWGPGMTRALKAFRRVVNAAYSPDVLRRLGVGDIHVKGGGDWIAAAVIHGRGSNLQHLLLIKALGTDTYGFMSGATQDPLFEAGPWPCLNPVCELMHKPVIDHYYPLKLSGYTPPGPIACFRCKCGFAYARKGPDHDGLSRMKPYRIVDRGQVWLDALKKMWIDNNRNVSEIARTLGVTFSGVIHWALKSELPFGEHRPVNRKTARLRDKLLQARKVNSTRVDDKVRVLEFLRLNPNATRSDVSKKLQLVIRRINQNDPGWSKVHLPARRKPQSAGSARQDGQWGSRDRDYSAQVPIVAARLLVEKGRPVRVSQNRILCELGFPHCGIPRESLPRTSAALLAAAESPIQTAVRRLRWLAQQTKFGSAVAVLRAAAVPEKWWGRSEIVEALEDLGWSTVRTRS